MRNYKILLNRAQRVVLYARSLRWDHLYFSILRRIKPLDLRRVSVDALGLSPCRSHWYSDSGGADLLRILRFLEVQPGAHGLDLGSGKGGAAFTMAHCPFSEILGVEISQALVHIARENASKLRLQNVSFVCMDAADFTNYDHITHIYMYNPLPCAVVVEVMQNISAAYERSPHQMTLIYKNPVCHDEIIGSGIFHAEREHAFQQGNNNVFRIYVNESRA